MKKKDNSSKSGKTNKSIKEKRAFKLILLTGICFVFLTSIYLATGINQEIPSITALDKIPNEASALTDSEKNEPKYTICSACGGEGMVVCPLCNGNAVKEITAKCDICNGTGKINGTVCEYCNEGFITKYVHCELCKGKGEIKCKKCEGEGVIKAQ